MSNSRRPAASGRSGNHSRLALADILGRADHNGLYRYPDDHVLPDLATGIVRIPGRSLTGKAAMLAGVAAALAFPDYFGANWDALEECLEDMAWWEDGVAVLIDDAQVPESQAAEDWRELLSIFHAAARHWKQEGRPFALLLQGSHAAWPRIDP